MLTCFWQGLPITSEILECELLPHIFTLTSVILVVYFLWHFPGDFSPAAINCCHTLRSSDFPPDIRSGESLFTLFFKIILSLLLHSKAFSNSMGKILFLFAPLLYLLMRKEESYCILNNSFYKLELLLYHLY